jgi:heat shock protein beta
VSQTLGVADSSDKHSTFSTTFPIYVREAVAKAKTEEAENDEDNEDADEADKWDYSWTHVNNQPPIWMR